MKILRLISALAIVAISVTACTNPKEKEKKELEEKVMAVHDEVMPKMGSIQSLQETLKQMIETAAQDTVMVDSAFIAAAKAQHTELEEAHNAMMDWMAGYTPPSNEQSVDDAVSYLREQEQSVSAMAEKMKSAIANAEKFVEKNGGEVEESNEDAHNHDSHDHHEEHNH